MKKDFSYLDSSGLVNVDTLSPSSLFYYRIQDPVALNPSAFGCKIAFYNRNNEAVYHREDCYAHELHSNNEIKAKQRVSIDNNKNEELESSSLKFVMWSKQGNAAYILEYYKWNPDFTYESRFLFLGRKYSYCINESKNSFTIVDELKIIEDLFDEEYIESKLVSFGVLKEPLHLDKIKKGIFNNKWHP